MECFSFFNVFGLNNRSEMECFLMPARRGLIIIVELYHFEDVPAFIQNHHVLARQLRRKNIIKNFFHCIAKQRLIIIIYGRS
jgi:hypothetical protein